MKSKALIYLSALALLVLLLVQYSFITDTYSTKERQLEDRYSSLAREAQGILAARALDTELDSILFELDALALEYLYGDPDTLHHSYRAFDKVLGSYHAPEKFIRDHILKAGESADFDYRLHITQLSLLDLDYELGIRPDSLNLPGEDALLTGSFTRQRNFYRISYDSYINFRHRTALVLREMRLILGLTLVMLLLVFSVFFLTLRNMLKQKRLSEMKSDFINNMTHELKTPLSTIAVASSSLGDPKVMKDGTKVERLSSTIKKQNRHLSELIDRILDIRVWERDQVSLQKNELEILPWSEELIQTFRLKQEEVILETEIQIETERILMDEVQVTTAVNNLLSNAVRYGGNPCQVSLGISTQQGTLEIRVTDNGPGFKREDQRHLFEKFFRGSEAKKRVIRGLGLGLYYVKQIAEAHGGSVTASSTEAKGSCFTIQIPS